MYNGNNFQNRRNRIIIDGHAAETGNEGEVKIIEELDRIAVGKILHDAYVPVQDSDNTSEIDVIFIFEKGIVVYERKYFHDCFVNGNPDEEEWTTDYSGEKHKFFNPIMQNRAHVRHLSHFLGLIASYFYPVVVFSNSVEFSNIELDKNTDIIRRDSLKRNLKEISDRSSDELSNEEILDIYNRLIPLTHADTQTRLRHIVGV